MHYVLLWLAVVLLARVRVNITTRRKAAQATSGAVPRMVRRRFVTCNVAGDLADDVARRVIAAAAEGADVVATQEMQRRDAREFCPPGFAVLQGKYGSTARCAIFYRTAALAPVTWSVLLFHLSDLFPSATRHFIWARFRDLEAGRFWNVAAVHFVPHADDDDGGVTHYPRKSLVNTAIDKLVAWAKAHTSGQDVILGDFNIDGRADLRYEDPHALMERLAAVNFVSTFKLLGLPDTPTHGSNYYDQVFVRLTPGLAVLVAQEVLPRVAIGQDHHPYAVDVDMDVLEAA